MPTNKKTYRHTGGKTTERARLLSMSDSTGYQSGSSGETGAPTAGDPPVVAARSASLSLVTGMDVEEDLAGGGDSTTNLLHVKGEVTRRTGAGPSNGHQGLM